jgi:hypothetical protein
MAITDSEIAAFFNAVARAIEDEHRRLADTMSRAMLDREALYAGKYSAGLYWKIREEVVAYLAFRAGIAALAPRYAIVSCGA